MTIEQQKKYLDTVTYGLIYPAFFGNMIYDLILQNRSLTVGKMDTIDVIICCLTVAYFILDYIHLHAELNPQTKDKTFTYMACDIATSFSFFLAFVFTKETLYGLSICFILAVPCIMLYYNLEIGIRKIIDYYKRFIIINILVFIVTYFIVKQPFFIIKQPLKYCLLVIEVFGVSYYTYYVFGYYHNIKKTIIKKSNSNKNDNF